MMEFLVFAGLIFGGSFWLSNTPACERQRENCKAQQIPWEKLQPGQQISPCGSRQTVKRIAGGVLVNNQSGGLAPDQTAFIPMKFEDEK